MRELALKEGIPDDCILMEEQARNTMENATNSKEIVEVQGIQSIVCIANIDR